MYVFVVVTSFLLFNGVLCHAVHGFLTNIIYMFGLFTPVQPDVVGMFKFNYMFLCHASSCICYQPMGLVVLFLSNQRLLESSCGIYRDRHFICFGDMCSQLSHPCHSSCIRSCCALSPVSLFIFEYF